jgi:hypothetical protein
MSKLPDFCRGNGVSKGDCAFSAGDRRLVVVEYACMLLSVVTGGPETVCSSEIR